MYKVLAAMRADMNEGWVWLSKADFTPRSIIKITNTANGKSVYCERLGIDENFIKEYNQSPRMAIRPDEKTLVINEWYRKKLGGIDTNASHNLYFTAANGWWGKFRANTGHPQVVVRLATWLAAISVGLGGLSFCIALLGILGR